MAELIRVNTRITKGMVDWLEIRQAETGIPRSTLIMLALDEYKRNYEVMDRMGEVSQLIQDLKELKDHVEEN